jgi:hypothetical protein
LDKHSSRHFKLIASCRLMTARKRIFPLAKEISNVVD